MGFVYEMNRATGRRMLVCEGCGEAGARKVACPAGYCQADALCPACRKSPEVKARRVEAHAGCAEARERLRAAKEAEEALKATGAYVFCASVYEVYGVTVRCWFRGANGDSKELVVSDAVRDGFDRLTTYDDALKAVA